MPCKSTCHQLPTSSFVRVQLTSNIAELEIPSTAFHDANGRPCRYVDDCIVGFPRAMLLKYPVSRHHKLGSLVVCHSIYLAFSRHSDRPFYVGDNQQNVVLMHWSSIFMDLNVNIYDARSQNWQCYNTGWVRVI